jgi:GT2 family glycosyltransferase
MEASVIVPTHNRRGLLRQCLTALLSQTARAHEYEIIVVDDGSSDRTAELVGPLAQSSPNVESLRFEEHRGRVAACGAGLKAARGDIAVFVDDDILVARSFVTEHLRYHRENGDCRVAVVGSVSFPREVYTRSNVARYLNSRYVGHRRGVDYSDLPAKFFGGGNSSARRADLIAVGGWNPAFLHYGAADAEMGYRLQDAGVRLIYAESARALHYGDATLGSFKAKTQECAAHSRSVMLDKRPEHYEASPVRFLLPIDRRRDTLSRVLCKLLVRLLLNRAVIATLEKMAALTDPHSWLYLGPSYRALQAGWVLEVERSRQSCL